MYNFDQSFIARIEGIWRPVKGQLIESNGGYRYLLCKYNGYAYYLGEGYEQSYNNLSDEDMTKIAVSYNLSEMNFKIEREKQRALEENLLRRQRTPTRRSGVSNVIFT